MGRVSAECGVGVRTRVSRDQNLTIRWVTAVLTNDDGAERLRGDPSFEEAVGERVEHGSEREPVEHFPIASDAPQLGDADPFQPFRLSRIRRFAEVCRAGCVEAMEDLIAQPVGRLVAHQRPQRSGFPARFFDGLAPRRLFGTLARVDATGRDLPAPGIGDEAMSPQQQHAAPVVVHNCACCLVRHANDVVLESAATRHLDIRQCETKPLAVVDGPLAVHRPSHRGKRNAEDRAETRRCSKWVIMDVVNLRVRPKATRRGCREV